MTRQYIKTRRGINTKLTKHDWCSVNACIARYRRLVRWEEFRHRPYMAFFEAVWQTRDDAIVSPDKIEEWVRLYGTKHKGGGKPKKKRKA